MKDSAVSHPGLLNPRRARRFLTALQHRVAQTDQRRSDLQTLHATHEHDDEANWGAKKESTTNECRRLRREALQAWDRAEEELIVQYEKDAVGSRNELKRISVMFRRKLDEEVKTIDRKYEARLQAIEHQYTTRKGQPGKDNAKELAEIEFVLTSIREDVDWARALTIRRLNHIPDTPPATTPEDQVVVAKPKSVQETITSIDELSRKAKKLVGEMQSGAAAKTVDSFYLPFATAVFLLLWAGGVLVFVTENWLLWGAVGIGVAFFLAFTVYLILLWPLRKMTRVLHPRIERVFSATDHCAVAGRKVSNQNRKLAEEELVTRRAAHLEAAATWKEERLSAVKQQLAEQESQHRSGLTERIQETDTSFQNSIGTVATKMRAQADQTAGNITSRLGVTDTEIAAQRDRKRRTRVAELKHLEQRLHDGLRRGRERWEKTNAEVQGRFPAWSSLLPGDGNNVDDHRWLDYLPLGWLDVSEMVGGLGESFPNRVPLVLHRRLHSTVVITADPSRLDDAVELCHGLLWRLLSAAPPSKAKLTLADPVGRGQSFTEFMALADHDPSMVGGRVWTSDEQIESRLGELAHHVEDILQSSLRDRFQRIEDYNEVAGSMASAYRAVAAVGCPDGLSRGSYRHLNALIGAGIRCGVTTILICPSDKPWPSDMPMPHGQSVIPLSVDASGTWRYHDPGWDDVSLTPISPPEAAHRAPLLKHIGVKATEAARVEVPLRSLLEEDSQGVKSTADEIVIPIGSQGANRHVSLRFGKGVTHHALVAGKTGSGKSTLLHAIITSGAYHYSPDELLFYLLDFKKGVEFKCYADSHLPHARVIGIESEREFGLSVLRALDTEMQARGDLLRSAGAGDISEYREKTGKPMPRILLVMDEFQELFVRDDRLAGDCSMLLDRLVRQGRSFGMHAILASQSLAGAYSLPRATLGQMAVRIAMQCSEADAAMILADDNTAARLISRPGEAIYNNAGGLAEGNQPVQVAWLPSDQQQSILAEITAHQSDAAKRLGPPIVFEGNVPCRWSEALSDSIDKPAPHELAGLLGESVEIGPPVALSFSRDTGRNALLIAPDEAKSSVLATTIVGMARQNPKLKVLYLDATRKGDCKAAPEMWQRHDVAVDAVQPRDAVRSLIELKGKLDDRDESSDPIVVVIDPIERFKDLRPSDSFSFSLNDSGDSANESGSQALETILRDGPSVGVFVMLVCGSAENYSRWISRSSQHDFELKILGTLNASDSSMLVDSPVACELSEATLLRYDESDGTIRKFRYCGLSR